MKLYYALACVVMGVHALFIVWVLFGSLLTRRRRLLGWLHMASLIWGIWIEAGPWPCPLTFAETWLEQRAALGSYQGGFLLHYLDLFVYPNIPQALLVESAVVAAIVNFGIYIRRHLAIKIRERKQAAAGANSAGMSAQAAALESSRPPGSGDPEQAG